MSAPERDLSFAKGTRGTVDLTAGETELVRRLNAVIEHAKARQRSNIGYASRAEATGHRIDARGYRKIAEANRQCAADVEDVRDRVRRGEFA